MTLLGRATHERLSAFSDGVFAGRARDGRQLPDHRAEDFHHLRPSFISAVSHGS